MMLIEIEKEESKVKREKQNNQFSEFIMDKNGNH
jgi:hypothetical protein